MNIGFEAKRFFTNSTGLGNYSRFVVRALSDFFLENFYVLYTPREVYQDDAASIISRSNVEVVKPRRWVKSLHATSLWRTFGICREASIRKLDVFHGLSQELPVGLPESLKKIVTVHDLIFYRYPEFYNSVDVAIYKQKLRYAARSADKIIAVSMQTKQDLQNFLQVDPAKIEIIHQGSHKNFKRKCSSSEIEDTRRKYGLPKEYILSVGTIEKRKNLIVLVRALALIPKASRIPLVVLGRPTAYLAQVLTVAKKLDVLSDIFFPENIPFAEFPGVYQGARLFVYPSLFEGFGIPLVEAIESQVPVITSVGSCFSEAAGPASIYVDPHNEEELAYQLNRVLSDSELSRFMVRESTNYIKQFEPKVIGGKIQSLYLGA